MCNEYRVGAFQTFQAHATVPAKINFIDAARTLFLMIRQP